MKVAGFGFRKAARVEDLLAALEAAGGSAGIARIATEAGKAQTEVFQSLANHLALPIEAVPRDALVTAQVETQSEKSHAMYGTGSLSEAAALIAAGPASRLTGLRVASPGGMATCAIAETDT